MQAFKLELDLSASTEYGYVAAYPWTDVLPTLARAIL